MKYPQTVSMPSAVSIWLEEQLEARGIDAVVYTRYILSLLHSHTVDVIYSEEDLQFPHLQKEVGKWSRGRKRSRRSTSDWWRHAQADAEHIKRSAAVECLLSATDQNCEIESLIDELCEKLKRAGDDDADASPLPPASPSLSPTEDRKLTPLELAEKYYAAFPPLCPPARPLEGGEKTPPEGSPRKRGVARRLYDNKLRGKENSDIMKARCPNRQRYTYFSRAKTARYHPTNNNNNWDLSVFINNKRFSAAPAKPTSRSEMRNVSDQCLEESRALWDCDIDMYEDLPVDIEGLLDSPPAPRDSDASALVNVANMRDSDAGGLRREYIPYGANIMTSIWAADPDAIDNDFNEAIDCGGGGGDQGQSQGRGDLALGFRFSSISIGSWPPPEVENERNSFFESGEQLHIFTDGFRNSPRDWDQQKKLSAPDEDDNKMQNRLASSLLKLNHSRERSGFTEVVPGGGGGFPRAPPPPMPFGRRVAAVEGHEDLLTSESSHFRPIAAEIGGDGGDGGRYADGATFVISNNLEKVEYKRSESGTMWLDNDNGQGKRYHTYKGEEFSLSPDLEFLLKFRICQNDKGCQTEEGAVKDVGVGCEKNAVDDTVNENPRALQPLSIVPRPQEEEKEAADRCVTRPDSAAPLWKYEEVRACSKCSDDAEEPPRASGGGAVVGWGGDDLRDIWSGGEICQTCLNGEDELPRPAPSLRLREDISQDGEQLLSDLSSLQRSYMDDLPPICETTRDISELLATPKERKRRHSFMFDDDEWSFASRLEEDCLIQISALPSMRSITF